MQTIAGPLAGDRAMIEVEVGAGAALELIGNAATLAYPSSSTAQHDLRVHLGPGARLAWLPEPLILAAGCDLESSVELELEAGAAALTRELVILGRHGERPGRYRSRLRCVLEGRPLLHDAVEIDPGGAAESSRAQLAGAGAFASLALAGPGRVMRALAPDAVSLREQVAPAEVLYRAALLGL